ncbi:hypothetical protein [Parapedobacter koreensis]|uniref:Thiamine pyrophosphokinase n=1 Tax=Parapedobacter koreensis TaxID=332977 RepID=A0A1H7T2T1_9SPHI|nr:hypothetical protein [Parapedobacter koreensis]SEL79171.1 thiamine pyrophosphokinase [Parapedobacter koreensis]
MSSHHIVKEDQEPALIIADIEGVAWPQLNQLMEWNPIVVTNGETVKPIAELGVHVDILITDGQLVLPQSDIITLPLAGTFLDTALAYLLRRGCKAVNIVSNNVDLEVLLRYADMNVVLLGNGRRVFAAKSGFRKWKPQGESVYAYTAVSYTMGLILQQENHYITEKDGFYSLYFAVQRGLVGECI